MLVAIKLTELTALLQGRIRPCPYTGACPNLGMSLYMDIYLVPKDSSF